MGMDLPGRKPTNSVGEHFYNNVWYWIPLWEYIASECSDIVTERDITLGEANSGHRISQTKATAIGKRQPTIAGNHIHLWTSSPALDIAASFLSAIILWHCSQSDGRTAKWREGKS